MPWVAMLPIGSASMLFGLVWYLWKHRGKPGANWFIATLAVQGVWCLTYAVALLVADPPWHRVLETVAILALNWLGFLFLGFALGYTGYRDILRSWLFRGLAVAPLVVTGLLVTTPYHDLLWARTTLVQAFGVPVFAYDFEVGFYVAVVFALIYTGVAVFLLVDTIVSYGRLYRSEAIAVGLSTIPVAAGVIVWLLDLGEWSLLNWGVVLSAPHAALDAYAFVGKNMFETSPATRRLADEEAIETLSNPVFVLDENERLVGANGAARAVFALDEASLGQPVDEAVDPTLVPSDEDAGRSLTVSNDGQLVEYSVQTSTLTDPSDTVVGHTVLLQDVTAERERRQRLEVQNRVLRHNLRNKLTTIRGHAEKIETVVNDGDVERSAGQIVATSEALVGMADKVRTFDRLRRRDRPFRPVALASLVEQIAEECVADSGVTVRTQIDQTATVRTDPALLRFALENVIENAVEHGSMADSDVPQEATEGTATHSRSQTAGADTNQNDEPIQEETVPTVTVSVRDPDDDAYAVALTVSDDGPGIPEAEVRALEEGREDALQHGSGIGLWLVRWTIEALGGSLAIESSASGTTIRLFLPPDSARAYTTA